MKRIVLLSDGTGNSSSKLFKTNVWRLYQSLDLDPAGTDIVQIACYNDGVGTSAFKPLALLGGVFGYGLKRNILHLYDFVCEHWEEGDEIYIFGFSRGAFTARLLAGLIATEGLLLNVSGAELAYATRDIYRRYRMGRSQTVLGPSQTTLVQQGPTIADPFVVKPFRALRDKLIHIVRRVLHQVEFPPAGLTQVDRIAFIGVWDTVAAYGSPLAELTRGIDDWTFPLSMPDRALNSKVDTARHALALDDERDTFHPLLWDEYDVDRPDRIKQVWFAGMHSDLGGGYPDDALSYSPLAWMMDEAAATGLRFLPDARERFAPPPSRSATLHDSRKGLAGYYRYQPRRLDAYLLPRNPETLVMVDPRAKAKANLRSVCLHSSVLERICAPGSRYAPIVLPATFSLVGPGGAIAANPEPAAARQARIAGQPGVWDIIWHKRVNYFATVLVSLILGTVPMWAPAAEAGSCEAWYCAIVPLIRAAGSVLPAAAQFWTEAFASNAGTTLILVGLLVFLLARGSLLQQRIQDQMWPLLAGFRGRPVTAVPPATGLVRRLRTSPAYLASIAWIKWGLAPNLFGPIGLAVLALGAFFVVAIPVLRHEVGMAEADGRLCGSGAAGPAGDPFLTSMPCWDSSKEVDASKRYRVVLTVDAPWLDDTVVASPVGFANADFRWLAGYLGVPVRRAIGGRWFQPFVTIISPEGHASVQPLEFHDEGESFVARLSPQQPGRVFIWVNDAVVPFFGWSDRTYANNHGSARIRIVELGDERKP